MATPPPPKPWKAEYAKSGRSSCKSCKSPINKDALRLGKMVTATQFDGFMPMWNHAACIFKKANQIKSVDDVEGVDLLRWEDQQKLKEHVETSCSSSKGGSLSIKSAKDGEGAIEVSKTSRATCRHCSLKIVKGMVRISLKPDGQGSRGLAWYHVKCFLEISPSSMLERLPGWESLPSEDREETLNLFNKMSSSVKQDSELENQGDKVESSQEKPLKGTKRRKVNDEPDSKILKEGENTSAGQVSRKGNANDTRCHNLNATDLDSKLEEQSKMLWAIKDELKNNVTLRELREMLEANGQDSRGSEYDLRECCADGMAFGALDKCPLCSGSLSYSGGLYRCHGYLSAWSKCNYSTTEPKRFKGKWKIQEESDNQYLCKWFKSQNMDKPERILPLSSASRPSNQNIDSLPQSSNNERLENLKVVISRDLKEKLADWKSKLESVGAAVHSKIQKGSSSIVMFFFLSSSLSFSFFYLIK